MDYWVPFDLKTTTVVEQKREVAVNLWEASLLAAFPDLFQPTLQHLH